MVIFFSHLVISQSRTSVTETRWVICIDLFRMVIHNSRIVCFHYRMVISNSHVVFLVVTHRLHSRMVIYYSRLASFYSVRVKGGMSLRNGMWHGLRHDIIMRNLKYGKRRKEIN